MEYNFDNIKEKIKNKEYKLIGSGSSRRVYDLKDGYVIKVAKDIRGINQNEAEYSIYQSSKSEFFAEIVSVSDDYRFLIMVKAKRIKSLNVVFKYYKVRNFNSLLMLNNLNEDIKENLIGRGDLTRATNWGLVNDVPQIIDYGLTHVIFKKYYRLSLFKKKPRPIKL